MRSTLTNAAAIIAATAIVVEATSSDDPPTITASNPIPTVTYTLSTLTEPDPPHITSSPSVPSSGCPTVTSTATICSTCIRLACLVLSTVTQKCDCPVVTATTSFPCVSGAVSGYCPGLGCETSYVVVPATATDCSISSSSTPSSDYPTVTPSESTASSTSSSSPDSSSSSGGESEPTWSSTGSSEPSATEPAPSGTTSGPVEAGGSRLGLSLGSGVLVGFVGLLVL